MATFIRDRRVPVFLTGLLLLVALPFASAGPAGAADRVNTNDSAFAIGGYDPVAYFTTGAPARGLEAFAHTWNGATWLFVSAAHRDLFAGDPEAYAPQYGGWCSWAVAHGYTARIDPDAWDIVDGKLYLNFSTFTQIRWRLAPSRYIADGDANWLRLSQ